MNQIRFRGSTQGLEMDRIVRDEAFSMTARHFHETYELYVLLEGERYYFIDQETYLVKAGDVVLIRPNQIHRTSTAGEPAHDRILLQIEEACLLPLLEECRIHTLGELFRSGASVIRVCAEDQKLVKRLLEEMEGELSVRREYGEMILRLLLIQLLILLSRCQQKEEWYQEPEPVRTWKHKKVHEVARYLMKNPETPESLPQLAARFCISKSYLSRIFREVTSFTVNEYKNISRIKKSQELLLCTDCSVTEIAGILGYDTVTYYERVFKRYTGTTPLKFRKNAVRGRTSR